MTRSSSDPVHVAMEQLRANPSKFQNTGGYERLVAMLENGHSPAALKALLDKNSSVAGDLLWAICELDDVSPFVGEAARHLTSPDRGTAGYATEVMLRGAHDTLSLAGTLSFLRSAPAAVREHAVFVLAPLGLDRVREIFDLGQWPWAAHVIDELGREERALEPTIETLIEDERIDRQLVGLVIATFASEQNGKVIGILERSQAEWVNNVAAQLRRMFQRRW